MNKSVLIIVLGGLVLTSSCSSYTAAGAATGGEFGHVIGSAIGGISGGWRGHHVGSLIGTVGGAVAGAAIGAAIENAQNRPYENAQNYPYDGAQNNPYDTGIQGDDRIVFDEEPGTYPQDDIAAGNNTPSANDRRSIKLSDLTRKTPIELRKATIIDANHDGASTAGEECTVMFEIMNNTQKSVYNVYPLVEDVTSNKHVKISPNLRVESIAPHQGIRYTATILADKRLKEGEIIVRVGVAVGQDRIDSQTQEFRIPTHKK